MSPQQRRWERIQEMCEKIEMSGDYTVDALVSHEPSAEIRKEALVLALAARAESQATSEKLPPPSRILPSTIGPYRILALLGEGGTGSVYSAVHTESENAPTVAVKHLHAHLNQGEPLARFRREYTILKRLNHPNLVRVMGGGEDQDGRSYLVMELVEGLPIDQHCDAKALDVAARVRLFISAAEAIQVAHENLVVHLDLKPSNVIVTAAGHVKVLDFGTAKLIDTTLTRTQQLTPSYASPEQLRGDPVTPRCDVYGLGLILYDVISGGRAFGDRSSLAGMALRSAGGANLQPITAHTTETTAKLRSTSPRRLQRILAGDLGDIVFKALDHAAAKRYASMADLAADLQCFLENKPVTAHPLTLTYRTQKFLGRHPLSASVFAAAALLILGLGGYGLAQWRRAEANAARASGTVRSMEFLLTNGVPVITGVPKDITFADVLVRTSKRLGDDSGMSIAERADMQTSIATVLNQLGRPDDALRSANTALDWAVRSENQATVLRAAYNAMDTRMSHGDCNGALTAMQQANNNYQGGAALSVPQQVSFLQVRAQVRGNCQSDYQGQLADLGATFALLDRYQQDPSIPRELLPFRMANIYGGYAYALAGAKDYGKAREVANAGLQYTASYPELRAASSLLHRILSTAAYASHQLDRAAAEMEIATALSEGSTSEFEVLRNRMVWASRIAEAGDPSRALHLIEESMQRLRANASQVGGPRWMVLIDAALAYQRSGHCGQVPALLREVDTLLPGGIASPVWRGNRLTAEALCLSAAGQAAEARSKAREALQLVNLPDGSPSKQRLEAVSK
jgi:serine/threonine protein kinase